MISVFLVEDEIVAREGLRNSIQWDQTPYTLAGEAADGEIALSVMTEIKPDILITDIKMPFMDGLTLSRMIKKIQPWVKIVIISGHDEFQYAREAISIGVDEFLLKPVSSEALLATLDKVAGVINEDKHRLENLEYLRLQAQSSADLVRERWLSDLVTGFVSTNEALEKAGEHGIDLIAQQYLVAIIQVTLSDDSRGGIGNVKAIILSQLENHPDVICFSQSPDRAVLLLKGRGQEPLDDTVYTLGQAVKHHVERNSNALVSVGIGSCVDRIGGIASSWSDADEALRQTVKTGRHFIVGFNGTDQTDGSSPITLDGGTIGDRLKYVRKSDIESIVSHYLKMVGEDSNQIAILGNYLLMDIIVTSSKLIEDLGGEVNEVIPFVLQRAKIIEILSSREKFSTGIRSILEGVIDFRESLVIGRYSDMIRKAEYYICENFSRQDLSLHLVAEYVNLSPNHFSTVFSQERGENFIEYLTRVRIDRAKHLLLTTSRKCADISNEAGFGDPHYFSFIFKKNSGVSPTQFRADSLSQTDS